VLGLDAPEVLVEVVLHGALSPSISQGKYLRFPPPTLVYIERGRGGLLPHAGIFLEEARGGRQGKGREGPALTRRGNVRGSDSGATSIGDILSWKGQYCLGRVGA
jgi:hypothetical protein